MMAKNELNNQQEQEHNNKTVQTRQQEQDIQERTTRTSRQLYDKTARSGQD